MLYKYLANSKDFHDLTNYMQKVDLQELNNISKNKNCVLAIINNENVSDNLKFETVQKLIKAGLNLRNTDADSLALTYFASRDMPQEISFLLENGAKLSSKDNSIFKNACWNGLFENMLLILNKVPKGYVDKDNYSAFALLMRGFIRDAQQADLPDKTKITPQYKNALDKMMGNSNFPDNASTVALWHLIAFSESDDHVLPLSEYIVQIGANPYICPAVEGDIKPTMCAADFAPYFTDNEWLQRIDKFVQTNHKKSSPHSQKVYEDMNHHMAKRKTNRLSV